MSSPIRPEQIEIADELQFILDESNNEVDPDECGLALKKSFSKSSTSIASDQLCNEEPQFIKQKCVSEYKKNFCKYCRTWQSKISRHFVNKHKEVPEIQSYINLTNTDKKIQILQRREACKMLISASNKEFNSQVKNNQELGKLIPLKKPKSEITLLTHVECCSCGALICRKYFFKHKKSCNIRIDLLNMKVNFKKKQTASLLVPNLHPKYKVLKEKIFPKMLKDPVSLLAQTDPLILEYGRRFLKGHMKITQRNYVSSKIRTLADLLYRAKKVDSTIKSMADCVNPKNFDIICDVVRKWSAFSEGNGECKVGSVPRRLCKSLKVCSEILWSQAIRDYNISIDEQIKIRDQYEKFLLLMTSDWAMEVNSVGDNSAKAKKLTKSDKIPLEEDIKKFCTSMKNSIENLTAELINSKNIAHYNVLTRLLLAFLTTFNGRRPSEVTCATVDNYHSTLSSNSDGSLSVFKVLAVKNNVKVPIVVPDFAQTAINVLLDHRSTFKVSGDLLFSMVDGTTYNTSHLISQFKTTIDLKSPNNFSANGMRHYWATISQKYEGIKKHMPKFLGHTTLTHEKFYEMPLNDIHLNVVAPLLVNTCLPSTSVNTSIATVPSDNCCIVSSDNDSLNSKLIINDLNNSNFHSKLMSKNCKPFEENNSFINPTRNDFHEILPIVDLHNDPDSNLNIIYETPKKRKPIIRKKLCISSSSSESESLASPNSNEISVVDSNELLTTADVLNSPDSELNIFHDETPKKRKRLLKKRCDKASCDYSSDSESESLSSPIINDNSRKRWITPEKEELFKGLSKTVLGLQVPGRGKVRDVWERSKIIKNRHSLQMTRIEVSKYFTKKKKVPTPIRRELINAIQNDGN